MSKAVRTRIWCRSNRNQDAFDVYTASSVQTDDNQRQRGPVTKKYAKARSVITKFINGVRISNTRFQVIIATPSAPSRMPSTFLIMTSIQCLRLDNALVSTRRLLRTIYCNQGQNYLYLG